MVGVLLLVLLAPTDAAREAETKAREALAQGDKAAALAWFEQGLRESPDTAAKAYFRDAYRGVGWVDPAPVNPAEERTVAHHIRDERVRVYRAAAGSLERQGLLHAAIIVRRGVIEQLGGPEAGGAKAEREQIARMVRLLTEKPTAEDQELVAKILRAKKAGSSLVKATRRLIDEKRYRAAVRLCQELTYGDFDQEVKNAGLALRKEAEDAAVADLPLEEKMKARDALVDERFDRLDVARSRHFLFIGPQAFVGSIPEAERTLLDLAYVYQSDLAQMPLTANGVRICVYYQETFDFGGGLAGGKLIRIGQRAIRLPVAGMLHYHELGHCIFGKGWLHNGFTEGLADFAAGFTLDALGQTPEAQRFITRAREQFVRYYLGRDVRYFDIQPYQPSAGFLFSFLPPGEAPFDWTPYRRAYRRMREQQFGAWPEREHQLMRYFGYLMSEEYGPEVFDQLHEWGWPVEEADFQRVPAEASDLFSELRQADYQLSIGNVEVALEKYRAVQAAAPGGPLEPRVRYGLLRIALRRGDEAAAAALKAQLGILDRFLVAGPFHAKGQTAHVVLPPEEQVRLDLATPVRFGREIGPWKPAKVAPDGYVDLLRQGFGYPEHACAFAVAYVRTESGGPARVWLGSDDGHTLYVNGRLAEKRATSRGFRFDDDFVDVDLRPGWNRVLLKVHNGAGAWGFLARVARPDGTPILGLEQSAEDHESAVPAYEEPKWKPVAIVNDDFKSLKASRWRTTVGRFDTQNGLLRPQGTEKLGLWSRFVVDPDRPPSGPADLIWLRVPGLVPADSFELEVVVAAAGATDLPARFGVTIDGENANDGQSGHTLVFEPDDGKLACTWYRYDQKLYQHLGAEVPPVERYRLTIRRARTRWWVRVNDTPVFDSVDTPRLPAFGFGLMTWGKAPTFDSFRLVRLDER